MYVGELLSSLLFTENTFSERNLTMSIMRKILKLFNQQNFQDTTTSIQTDFAHVKKNKMEQYYKREQVKFEINRRISYQDISIYDKKPFDLKQPFIVDDHFTCISLSGSNLDLAYHYLQLVNEIIKPLHKYFKDITLPNKIKTDYLYNNVLPTSHLRLTPYTSTMRKCKYPFYLWLQDFDDYGYVYLYRLYFNQNGFFQKGDLSINGKHATISYQIQIRNDGLKNYVRRIDKTLYTEPNGTVTVYINNQKRFK